MSSQNSPFLFIGFTVAWLIIIIYVISIALREKKLRQELDRVKRMMEEERASEEVTTRLPNPGSQPPAGNSRVRRQYFRRRA